MADRATLLDLDRRLAEATGPDSKLDALLACAFPADPDVGSRPSLHWPGKVITRYGTWRAPAYTASVDVASVIVERALPGQTVGSLLPVAEAATPALALLRALIAALLSQTEQVATSDPVPALDADDEDFE